MQHFRPFLLSILALICVKTIGMACSSSTDENILRSQRLIIRYIFGAAISILKAYNVFSGSNLHIQPDYPTAKATSPLYTSFIPRPISLGKWLRLAAENCSFVTASAVRSKNVLVNGLFLGG